MPKSSLLVIHLKTLDLICQIAPDQLSEHAKALQIWSGG
jgi:hypothetical protein